MLATQLRLGHRPVAGAFAGSVSIAPDFDRLDTRPRIKLSPGAIGLDSQSRVEFSPGAIGLDPEPRVEFSPGAIRLGSGPRGSSRRNQQHAATTRRAAQHLSN
jgi:hypothetical protein